MPEFVVQYWKLIDERYDFRELIATYKFEADSAGDASVLGTGLMADRKLEWDDEDVHRVE